MSTSAPSHRLESALRAVLGDGLETGDERHRVDGVAPAWAARPVTTAALLETLAKAAELRSAVIPWGAGSQMPLGSPPSRYDVALRTEQLNDVVEYEPADLTVAVQAGITLGRLQTVLSEHGQFLPLDGPPGGTIGGLLAVGHGGPSQHAYGLPRDWLLGCRIALAEGTLVRAGGRVVKNVAGYDLTRMVVGSLGTLGVIVEATLKVAPLPPLQEALLIEHADAASACRAVRDAAKRGLALKAAAVTGAQAAYWLAGPAGAVERTRRELEDAAAGDVERLEGDAAGRWWQRPGERDQPAEVTWRISVPPSRCIDTMERLDAIAGQMAVEIQTAAQPTTGVVSAWLRAGSPDAYVKAAIAAREAAVAAAGSLVLTKAPVAVKERLDVWGDSPALPLMRRLKAEFDPTATLNAGRFVGGI